MFFFPHCYSTLFFNSQKLLLVLFSPTVSVVKGLLWAWTAELKPLIDETNEKVLQDVNNGCLCLFVLVTRTCSFKNDKYY